MTLPASGPISMANVNTELQRSSTTTVSLNDTIVRTLFGVPSGQISMSNGYGKAYTIPGNSGILTSGSSFTLPTTSGLTISVLIIGGGGGGGGGSSRTFAAGFTTGGGGGGSGGNVYESNISVTPGQSVTFNIGGGGAGGAPRDGVFTSGGSGFSGGSSSVTVNGSVVAVATPGYGGIVSPTGTGGSGGSFAAGGAPQLASSSGADAGSGTTIGGLGAKGYTINTTVGLSIGSIIGYGLTGTAGAENSGQYGVSGTVYGAGGTGGGCSQSDVYNYNNIFSTAGTAGAVFIWWGY